MLKKEEYNLLKIKWNKSKSNLKNNKKHKIEQWENSNYKKQKIYYLNWNKDKFKINQIWKISKKMFKKIIIINFIHYLLIILIVIEN